MPIYLQVKHKKVKNKGKRYNNIPSEASQMETEKVLWLKKFKQEGEMPYAWENSRMTQRGLLFQCQHFDAGKEADKNTSHRETALVSNYTIINPCE